MHSLITGITGTGKSTFGKILACQYKQAGKNVLVLDPFYKDGDTTNAGWDCDFITADPQQFLQIVFANKNCVIFIDESGQVIGRWGGVMNNIATQGRHNGHKIYFITQRPKQIDINSRTQCTRLFTFRLSLDDAKMLAREFADPLLENACELNIGEFICYTGIGKTTVSRIFPRS